MCLEKIDIQEKDYTCRTWFYSIQYSFLINIPRHKITIYKSSWLICDPRCFVKTAYPDYGKVDVEDFIKYFVLHAIQSNKYNILSVLERGRLGAYPNPVILIGLRTTKKVQVKLNHDLTMVKYTHLPSHHTCISLSWSVAIYIFPVKFQHGRYEFRDYISLDFLKRKRTNVR